MTTKVKTIINISIILVYYVVLGLLIPNRENSRRHDPIHTAPQWYEPQRHTESAYPHEVGEESPTVSLKGKYKVEEQKGLCSCCMEEPINVIKPFSCNHTICEECLDQWAKSRATTSHYEFIDGRLTSVQSTANCPQCRAELKQPTQ